MRDLAKCLGFSLGLHLIGIATLLFLADVQVKIVRPIVIDLTLADFPESAASQPANREAPAAPLRLAAPAGRQLRAKKESPVPVEKVAQFAVPAAAQGISQPTPSEPKNLMEAGEGGNAVSKSLVRGDTGGGVLSSPASVDGVGKASASAGNERQRYLAEHFSYIRDLVRKHLVYPTVARRMGWGGKAVVAFTVMEDGNTSNIRLVESSGTPLLDKSALETIRRAAPFPRPPVRAEIVLPVLFKLL